MIKLKLSEKLSELNFTQKDLSLMTNIRQATISAYCNNEFKHIVTSHLDKICYALKCNPTDIIEYDRDTPEDIDDETIDLLYKMKTRLNGTYTFAIPNASSVFNGVGGLSEGFRSSGDKMIEDYIFKYIDNLDNNEIIEKKIEHTLQKIIINMFLDKYHSDNNENDIDTSKLGGRYFK